MRKIISENDDAANGRKKDHCLVLIIAGCLGKNRTVSVLVILSTFEPLSAAVPWKIKYSSNFVLIYKTVYLSSRYLVLWSPICFRRYWGTVCILTDKPTQEFVYCWVHQS